MPSIDQLISLEEVDGLKEMGYEDESEELHLHRKILQCVTENDSMEEEQDEEEQDPISSSLDSESLLLLAKVAEQAERYHGK